MPSDEELGLALLKDSNIKLTGDDLTNADDREARLNRIKDNLQRAERLFNGSASDDDRDIREHVRESIAHRVLGPL